ncbi:TonB-dependent siderophore receptor [Quatrionicoccus australiensis]|uniref:TonB-dependent siderophore receptor n=1 Tax=Quatrionicoccus australiensis TaxID=138118 RepID=UPI001CF8E24E|nr:TonB-dependent siderophore receptor [Quatrionicoccus australiensis]UCV16751.1 TonB-dependent siderophore receptor [Quatrionicoccus australiensis]
MHTSQLKYPVLRLALVAAFALPAQAQETQLGEVQVVGRSEGQSYYSDEAGVARAETPLREVPQAVRVVPRQAIDDIGAVRLEEAYDYVSGVNRQNNFGGLWDNFSIRGFAGNPDTGANFLRNGFAGNRGYNAPRDMANVERLEVIKGPASALYGGSEPGGILNIVTKKPQFKTGHAVEVYAGSYDTYRTTIDSTGPISDTLAYRLNMAYEDKGSFRDHVDSQRYLIAPSFTWLLSPSTVVNYDFEAIRQKAPMDRGVVAINGQVGSVPRDRFLGEPNDGDITIDNKTHNLTVEHEFSSDWKAKAGLAYRTTSLEGYSTEASPRTAGSVRWTTAGAPVIERERRYRDYSSNDLAFQGEVHGKFATGWLKHEVLAGIDSYRFELDQVMKRGRSTTTYGLNIYDPVYGQTPLALNTTPTNTLETQNNTGFFLQDQIAFATDWRLLVGLRHDRFRQEIDNRSTGVRSEQEHNVTTPRLGLTWLATPTLSVYALASESFRANNGVDAAGGSFDPERGKSKEIGLKYEAPNKRYGGTVSVFEIDKKNVLTNDPANAGFSIAAGEARSRGVEFDFSGQITDKIRVLANYAFIDAEITKDSNAALVGARLINVPKHSGSALAMYEDGFSAGRYGFGAGATYVGKRAGNSIDSFELPGYTTVRTMAYWKPNKTLRISLDIDNLFDKTYYASSYDVYWITPGAPRTFTLGMQAKF